MPTPDLDTAPAAALAAAVAAGEVTALALCEAAIRRIEQRDGAINAVVVRDFDRAREQARARDRAVARGERSGALLGVPMTVKESYNVAGLATTWGLPPFRAWVAQEDAVLVQRLKTAGAVILGKTNVPPALADWQAANPIYGRTNHPLDPARTPGGSSGGAAAALAAGMVALELGSDIGGSIRVPAHFCGVFGHKPSYGLLPQRGHDFPGTDAVAVDLAVCGPLARSAADLALAFDVLAGPDADEAVGYRMALPPPRHATVAGCRTLVLDEHPCARTETQLREALHTLAADLADAGARVARGSPLLPDLAASHRAYLAMLTAITTRGMPGDRPVISAHEWFALLDQRGRVRRQWQALFEAFDVVLAPPFGVTAFEHQREPDMAQRTHLIDGEVTAYGDQIAWPGIATFAGLPATAAPIARSAEGLPIGVQIIGPYLEDRTTLAVAAQIEALRRG